MNMNITELEAQKKAIDAKIERAKKAERKNKIKEIVRIIELYNITFEEIKAVLELNVIKYLDQKTGKSWNGKGKQPKWIREALEAGNTLEDFLVN